MSRRKWFQMLVITVVTAFLSVFSGITSAQGNSGSAFERVKEVQERHTSELMAKAGVVGTAVGEDESGQLVVLVLLEHGSVPGIPQQLEGISVRPLVTGKIEALPKGGKPGGGSTYSPTSKWPRPVPIGVSTGHPAITAGTIGCRVRSGGTLYALSNNHVYANVNRATSGDAVIQPGAYDGGTSPADDIANLYNFCRISFDGSDNTIDAAIATIQPISTTDGGPRVGNATPPNGYGIPSRTTVAPYFRQAVQKYGRTTSLTKGKVYALNAAVNVSYGDLDGDGHDDVAHFVGQIVVTPGAFSAGGDSGSLIVTQSGNYPVGLLFAGSSSVTIANPIDLVLSYFGVTVDGQ
jgi:hypothetical protein